MKSPQGTQTVVQSSSGDEVRKNATRERDEHEGRVIEASDGQRLTLTTAVIPRLT